MATRLLSAEDIYDTYGLEWVLQVDKQAKSEAGVKLDAGDRKLISARLREIQQAYIEAAKSRIRAEATFLGVDIGSLTAMISKIREHLGKAIPAALMANSEHMMRGGTFNLFGEILKSHQAAGSLPEGIDVTKYGLANAEARPRPEVDPDWFRAGATVPNGGRITEDARWAEIARAYVALEAASSDGEIIRAVDRINQLQHNSFHVLIDLQTGRMLSDYENATEDRTARKQLQEILDIKLTAKSPIAYKDKMSKEVQDLLYKYRDLTIQIT